MFKVLIGKDYICGKPFVFVSLSQFAFPVWKLVWVEKTPVGVTVKSIFFTSIGVITRKKNSY